MELKNWMFIETTGEVVGEIVFSPNNHTLLRTKQVKKLSNNVLTTITDKTYTLGESYISSLDDIKNYLNKETMDNRTQLEHSEMVRTLVKDPVEILVSLKAESVNLIHAILGISGEAGELLDIIKKHVIHNKPLDLEHVKEELGDLEFYLEQLRQALSLSRTDTLQHNIKKLPKRYPVGYTDSHAQERLDKVV